MKLPVGLPKITVERLAQAFLLANTRADEIVIDTRSGLPVKAIYSGPTIFGQIRSKPAVYWFSELVVSRR